MLDFTKEKIKGKLLFFSTLLLAIPAFSQSVQLDFSPKIPILFQRPTTGEQVMFFFPEKTSNANGYPCLAAKLDVASGKVIQRNSVFIKCNSYKPIKALAHASRSDAAFLAVENDDKCYAFRLDWDALELTQTATIEEAKGQNFVVGPSDGAHTAVMAYQKGKQKDEMVLYTFGNEGQLEPHRFPIPEVNDRDFERVFKSSGGIFAKKDYRPLSVQIGLEYQPEYACRKPKLYVSDKMVWLAFDTEASRGIQLLKLYGFDLEKDSLSLRKFKYGDDLDDLALDGSSYVYDNKIFQLAADRNWLHITVRDLWTGNILRQHHHTSKADSIEFANSAIYMPGRGSFGIEKEYKSPRKFFLRFKTFQPAIQVRKEGNDYLMCISGFEIINTSSMSPVGGGGVMVMHGGTYERSCAFYSALDANSLEQSQHRYPETLVTYLSDMVSSFDGITDESVYLVGSQHYMGSFNKSSKKYTLRKVVAVGK